MNLVADLVTELAAHAIRIKGDNNITLMSSGGAREMPLAEAIKVVKAKAQENSTFLLNLWRQATALLDHRGQFPSNTVTQRLFVSAIKHLAKMAMTSDVLKEGGITNKFGTAVREDITVFSQVTMSKLVDCRLAIDWINHLVAYDTYRAELLEAYAEVKDIGVEKVAQAGPMGRDYSVPSEQSIPWWMYRDRLSKFRTDVRRTEDKSLIDRDEELRTEQGMEDQGDKGLLDEYDELANGLRMKKRNKGTMLDMYQKNQKIVDYDSGEFGVHAWGDKNNAGPHEMRSTTWGR